MVNIPGKNSIYLSNIDMLNKVQKSLTEKSKDPNLSDSKKNDINKSIFDTIAKKNAVLENYQAFVKQQNGQNPQEMSAIPNNMFDLSNGNAPDAQYAYVNNNTGGKGNIAPEVYTALTDVRAEVHENGSKNILFDNTAGILATKDNDVSTSQTFTAWLLNDNEKSTAFIGNTSAEQLADNMFEAMDNIKDVEAEKLEKNDDGSKFILRNKNNPENSFEVNAKPFKSGLTPGNNVINSSEYGIFARAVASDSSIAAAKGEMGTAQGAENERISSASTVKINYKTDPYYQFMRAAGAADGASGITREELRAAIKEIATEKDGGIYFDKEKLNAFLAKNNHKNDAVS